MHPCYPWLLSGILTYKTAGNNFNYASREVVCLLEFWRPMPHCCWRFKLVLMCSCMQGFWKGVLPSIVMVSNPSVNYMLYEYLRARLEDWRRALTVSGGGALRQTTPTGALPFMLAADSKGCV